MKIREFLKKYKNAAPGLKRRTISYGNAAILLLSYLGGGTVSRAAVDPRKYRGYRLFTISR